MKGLRFNTNQLNVNPRDVMSFCQVVAGDGRFTHCEIWAGTFEVVPDVKNVGMVNVIVHFAANKRNYKTRTTDQQFFTFNNYRHESFACQGMNITERSKQSIID